MSYEAYIKTDKKGILSIYNKGHFDQFFKENPSRDFVLKVEEVGKNGSERLFAYLHAEVLPKLIEGFRSLGEIHNKVSVQEEMKKYISVVLEVKIIDGKEVHNERDFEELNHFERKRYIDEAIIFAATHLHTIIDDPK